MAAPSRAVTTGSSTSTSMKSVVAPPMTSAVSEGRSASTLSRLWYISSTSPFWRIAKSLGPEGQTGLDGFDEEDRRELLHWDSP
jgi:hypothetical protein